VIRIRYSSKLQPGLHGRVERHGRATYVYLLPGLTPQQRRAALRRMRQQGRMGICPALPTARLGGALLADRVRTAFGQAGAIVRVHPAGSTLPVMAVSVAIASFLVLSALSVHIVHLPPQAMGGNAAVSPAPEAGTGQSTPATGVGPSSGGERSSAGRTSGQGSAPTTGGFPVTAPATQPTGQDSGSGASSGDGQSPSPGPVEPSPGSSGPASAGPTSTGTTTPPTQDPAPSATTTGTPAPDPDPTPSPTESTESGKSGGTGGQVCVEVGSLGVCLSL
jgi:hypothetical protein